VKCRGAVLEEVKLQEIMQGRMQKKNFRVIFDLPESSIQCQLLYPVAEGLLSYDRLQRQHEEESTNPENGEYIFTNNLA
jgi:hypothetical protein